MTSGGSYTEVVKIVWDVKDAEEAIDKLLGKINQLDSQSQNAGQSAGRKFSAGFRAGMADAFAVLDAFQMRMDNLASRMRDMGSAPMPGASAPPPKPHYRASYEGGQWTTTPSSPPPPSSRPPWEDPLRGLSAYDEYGRPRFPGGIQGGSGIMYDPRMGRWRGERGSFIAPPDTSWVQSAFFNNRPPPPPPDFEWNARDYMDAQNPVNQADVRAFGEFVRTTWNGGVPPAAPIRTPEQLMAQFIAANRQRGLIPLLGGGGGGGGGLGDGFGGPGPFRGMVPYGQTGVDQSYGWSQGFYNWGMAQGTPIPNSPWVVLPQGALPPGPGGAPPGIQPWRFQSQGQVPLPPSGPILGGGAGGGGAGGGNLPPWVFANGPGGINFNAAATGQQNWGGALPNMNLGRLGSHATWMSETLLIGSAFALAAKGASDFAEELVRLDTVAQRLNFIDGGTRTDVANQFLGLAGIGIAPANAGEGMVAAAQYGLSSQQNKTAQELASFFGQEEYANIVAELYQTQQRANSAGLQSVDVANYIATAYKTASGSLEEYFDSLQMGIELSDALGLSAEQAGLAVLKVSQGLEGSPNEAASLLQSIRRRLTGPGSGDVRAGLAREGITGPNLPDYYRQLGQVAASGDMEKLERVLSLVAGGINVSTRLSQLRTSLAELYEIMGDPPEMSSWDQLFGSFSDTTQFRINKLTASWRAFLAAFGDTGAAAGALDFIDSRLNDTANILNNFGFLFANMDEVASRIVRGQTNPAAAAGQAAKEIFTDPNRDLVLDPLALMTEFARRMYQNMLPRELPQGRQQFATNLAGDTGRTPPMQPRPVEGLDELPQGGSFAQFLRYATEIQNQLNQIPGYVSELTTVAIRDPGRSQRMDDDRYRIVTLDAKAIQDALDKVAKDIEAKGKEVRGKAGEKKGIDDFGGFDTFPEGLDWNRFVSGVRSNEQKLLAQVPGYQLDQKTIAFYDETGGFYRMLTADQEAIRRELAEQTKLMNQQITGVFNVPSGGEALVAFFALQQGFVPDEKRGGGGGTKPLNIDADGLKQAGASFDGATGKLSNAAVKFETAVARFGTFLTRLPSAPEGKGLSGAGKDYGDIEGLRPLAAGRDTPKIMPGVPKGVGQGPVVNNVINLRNTVVLDGRVIVNQLLREFQKQLRSSMQVSSVSSRSNLGV